MTPEEIAEARAICRSAFAGDFTKFAYTALPKALDALEKKVQALKAAEADRDLHLNYHAKLQTQIIEAHAKALPENWEYCGPRETIDLLVAECKTAQAERDALKLTVEQQAGEIERLKWPTVSAMGVEIKSLKTENEKLAADNAALREGLRFILPFVGGDPEFTAGEYDRYNAALSRAKALLGSSNA